MDLSLSSVDLAGSRPGVVARHGQPLQLSLDTSRNFLRRILLLAFLLSSELTVLSVWFFKSTQLTGSEHDWPTFLLRCLVGFAAIFVPCAYLKNRSSLQGIHRQVELAPIRWGLLIAHCSAMLAAVALFSRLYSAGGLGRVHLLSVGWLVAGLFAIACAALAFLPGAVWAQLVRRTGALWAYTSLAVALAALAGNTVRLQLWQPGPLVQLTFRSSLDCERDIKCATVHALP